MTCRHFHTCGGCSLPGVPYAEQLERKRARLVRVLGLPVPPMLPSPLQSAFRHKVAFVFGAGPGGRGLVMGHYAAGSKHIVPVEECPVHSTRGNRLAFALRDALASRRIDPALLRHVIIRTSAGDGEAVVMLVVTRNDRSLRAPVRAFLESADPPDGFFVNVHDRPGPYMVGRETLRLAGRSHVRESVSGAGFLVSPTAFFQTNVGAAGELVRLVATAAGQARRVLDLYSGSGLFAIPLALGGARVVAVEENPVAVRDGQASLRLNRLPEGQVRFIAARAEDALARLERESFDTVVLDPPREGCAASVIDAVFNRLKPARAVYVSCNPDSLAAELPAIRGAGYEVSSVLGVDMFPHTEHIETVVGIEKGARR